MSSSTINYRGEQFRLSTNFSDYEEYTDVADPIAQDEHERVAEAVRNASVSSAVASIDEMVDAIGDVKFPGFQSGTLVVKDKKQFGQYYGMHAMIPYTDFSRYFLFAQRADQLELIHETELETFPNVFHFAVTDDKVIYYRSDGQTHEFRRAADGAEP